MKKTFLLAVIIANLAYKPNLLIADDTCKSTVMSAFSKIATIAVGDYHTCILDSKEIKCFGDTYYGQLKVPSFENPKYLTSHDDASCAWDAKNGLNCWGRDLNKYKRSPAPLKNPSQISMGSGHICAIDDGSLICWGDNFYGESKVPA